MGFLHIEPRCHERWRRDRPLLRNGGIGLAGGYAVKRDKSFELQRTRERQVHEFQSKRLVFGPPDRGAFDGQGLELLR